MNLIPLFLVSLAAVGYETALTRYFAVAKWSEYGYWVISIVMAGFALSGVVLALFRDGFARRGQQILTALPATLVITAALGFYFTATNPFNPLQLQNLATWQAQLWNIGGYYAALLPFFFLAGLFISLTFVMNETRIGKVYGFDLTGAGTGSALVLASLFVVPAFSLAPLLLLPLAASALFGRRRPVSIAVTLVALVAAEALLLLGPQPEYNDYKAIYAPLHTPDAKTVARVTSPRGDYMLLDNFTERVDTDISNNAGMLGLAGPPATFGLYRDGNRIAALPRPGKLDVGYAASALDALPYTLIPRARTLVAGGSGGFRAAEVLALGAAQVRVVENEPVLEAALRDGLGPSPALDDQANLSIVAASPLVAARGSKYDIIDVSSDFLDTSEANVSAYTDLAFATWLGQLAPNGIISIPVSIRDFPVYALRVLATARAALLQVGVTDPAAHVIAYRSAWSVRVLISRDAWSPARIAAAKQFCNDRSFDLSWYPGIDIVAARDTLYNDLPTVSFEKGEVESGGPDDAIADEAGAVLAGKPSPSSESFNLSPVTLDRPFFYAVLRLDRIGTILRRLEILPQAEVGALVNLAVLAQAMLIAALVLALPLAAVRRLRGAGQGGPVRVGLVRTMLYFPALALGFLFIELSLIEKASFWLNDRTSGFALVLTGMLVFSGAGAMISPWFEGAPGRGARMAAWIVVGWTLMVLAGLHPLILATLDWPWLARAALVTLVLAPVSLALGLPFPLGLSRMGQSGFLPWAWGLNGAFSVVATPLASLIAREAGFSWVLLCAAALYGIALLTFPHTGESNAWHDKPA